MDLMILEIETHLAHPEYRNGIWVPGLVLAQKNEVVKGTQMLVRFHYSYRISECALWDHDQCALYCTRSLHLPLARFLAADRTKEGKPVRLRDDLSRRPLDVLTSEVLGP